MIVLRFDQKKTFQKEMNNLVEYSLGFMEGVEKGKKVFFASVGEKTAEIFSSFIDSMARQNPSVLHHVYEWNLVGSPEARLFDLNYTVSNLGLSLRSSFRQSTSIKNGSKVPFYNKATMMEAGMSVIIRPRESDVLAFEVDGTTVFTPNPVLVNSVGGETAGGFQQAFDTFVNSYFAQSFMEISGVKEKFGNMTAYKKNLQSGLKAGRSSGIPAGFRWIANVGIGA